MKKFQELYNNYLESGLNIKDFCINQGIHASLFFYWKNKLKDQLAPKNDFVPLVIKGGPRTHPLRQNEQVRLSSNAVPVSSSSNIGNTCEIKYPNGVCIKIDVSTDMALIQSLILLNTGDHV